VTRALGLALLLSLLGAGLAAQELEPAPSSMVSGPQLSVPELNLSVSAPSSEWQWLVSPARGDAGPNGYRAFSCRRPGSPDQFLIGVFNPYWEPETEARATQFVAGIASSFEKKGWTVESRQTEASPIPWPGSFRYALKATNQDRSPIYVYGYLGAKGRLFTFQHVSSDATEAPKFRTLMESVRFLGEAPRDPLDGAGQATLFLLAIVTLLLGGIGALINAAAKRVAVNMWRVALIFLAVIAAGLAFFWLTKLPRDTSAERRGYAYGACVVSPVLWPGLFAYWRSRRLEKRRVLESPPATRAG